MSTRPVTMVTALIWWLNCSRSDAHFHRLEGGAERCSSDSSVETETISAHGAVFTASTADCRPTEGETVYVPVQ